MAAGVNARYCARRVHSLGTRLGHRRADEDLRRPAGGLLVGGCELRLGPAATAEVSYWTSASQRRRGYATRALVLLLDYARSIGITTAVADVADDNLPSRQVAEKAGLRKVSIFADSDGTTMIRYLGPVWARPSRRPPYPSLHLAPMQRLVHGPRASRLQSCRSALRSRLESMIVIKVRSMDRAHVR